MTVAPRTAAPAADAQPRPVPIAVCVPVRNEAALLPTLLSGLEAQRSPLGDVVLCFHLDGCDDGSDLLLRQHAAKSRWRFSITAGTGGPSPNAGNARRRAMTMGVEALGTPGGYLLTTDADSVPAADWLREMQAALAHADVAAGRIVRRQRQPAPIQDRVEAYYDRLVAMRRKLDPVAWECHRPHHYTGGANLGFRSAAYVQLGGFMPRPLGEDAQIVDDAARAGLRVRRHSASVVHTSDRREGRAAGGLAATLASLDGGNAGAVLVGHPADAVWQYRLHARARRAFTDNDLGPIAQALGLSADHVVGVARDCPNEEAFAMRLVPALGNGRTVPLTTAEAILEHLVANPMGVSE